MDDTASNDPAVRTDVRDGVLVITLDRPDKRNALNWEVTAGLDAAMNRLEDDPDLRVGILTGGTSIFSAGADLRAGVGYPTERGGLVGLIQRRRAKPLVAAVEGMALGGGMELVLSCDLVTASDQASFGLPEARLGLIPDFGGAFRVGKMLPPNVAREMLLIGRPIDAARAERLGFVNRLTEPGGALNAALALAGEIAANAPLAIREALGVANSTLLHDDEADWARSDAAHVRLMLSRDLQEGIGAFFDRRVPRWSGQ
jgi:enoyl-CoA hydratase